MGLLIRTLLIWLLVLAVPAQAAAAATMAFCGPNHHGAGATSHAQRASYAEHAQHGSDAGSAAHQHRHEHQHQEIAAPDEANDAASASPDGPAKHVHGDVQKCSACASCCTFGAILSTLLVVPAPALTPTVFAAVVLTVDAFAADGPERPPRIVLA